MALLKVLMSNAALIEVLTTDLADLAKAASLAKSAAQQMPAAEKRETKITRGRARELCMKKLSELFNAVCAPAFVMTVGSRASSASGGGFDSENVKRSCSRE